MRISTLARRYAAALLEVAKHADVVDKVESDLGLITYSLQSMPRLQEAITHPLIAADRKKEIVAEVFSGRIEQMTLQFLNLVIDKRRGEILSEVELEYVRLANEYRGILQVVAASAVPLTQDEQDRLCAKLRDLTGKRIELRLEQDSELIGGLTVRIGDTIIDGSIKGHLASLKKKLLG